MACGHINEQMQQYVLTNDIRVSICYTVTTNPH